MPLKEFELLEVLHAQRRPRAHPRPADRPGLGHRLLRRHQDARRAHQAHPLDASRRTRREPVDARDRARARLPLRGADAPSEPARAGRAVDRGAASGQRGRRSSRASPSSTGTSSSDALGVAGLEVHRQSRRPACVSMPSSSSGSVSSVPRLTRRVRGDADRSRSTSRRPRRYSRLSVCDSSVSFTIAATRLPSSPSSSATTSALRTASGAERGRSRRRRRSTGSSSPASTSMLQPVVPEDDERRRRRADAMRRAFTDPPGTDDEHPLQSRGTPRAVRSSAPGVGGEP